MKGTKVLILLGALTATTSALGLWFFGGDVLGRDIFGDSTDGCHTDMLQSAAGPTDIVVVDDPPYDPATCGLEGLCTYDTERQRCVATAESCAESANCQQYGRCERLGGSCAVSEAGCRQAEPCTQEGIHCEAERGICIETSDARCRASRACTVEGRCVSDGASCVVGNDDDCRQATVCAEHQRCIRYHNGQSCERADDNLRYTPPPTYEASPQRLTTLASLLAFASASEADNTLPNDDALRQALVQAGAPDHRLIHYERALTPLLEAQCRRNLYGRLWRNGNGFHRCGWVAFYYTRHGLPLTVGGHDHESAVMLASLGDGVRAAFAEDGSLLRLTLLRHQEERDAESWALECENHQINNRFDAAQNAAEQGKGRARDDAIRARLLACQARIARARGLMDQAAQHYRSALELHADETTRNELDALTE